MNKAKFILSKEKVFEQYNTLKKLGIKISYSYKTNRKVGDILQEISDCEFSIHNPKEINMIKDKNKIWFFSQAWREHFIKQLIKKNLRNFVVDNESDLNILIDFISKYKIVINLILRLKSQEHRITSGKYFVYGMSSKKINTIIKKISNNKFIKKLGVHLHRKSQNASEWEILEELKDSLTKESLMKIKIINIGGGIPIKYKTYRSEILDYIFEKIKETKKWLKKENKNIEIYVEPGRFIAGPSIKLETRIILIYNHTIVVNTSIYNCALDSIITNTRMLVKEEKKEDEKGNYYMIKGNSPARDDIFRYKVKLKNPKIGDKLIFLNAGAYNYSTDFCGFEKLKTKVLDRI